MRQAHHRIIDSGVAVRMVLAKHFTNDTGAFLVDRARANSHVVHRVQNTPVHRLEAVARIGQGARDNDAHGIIQVRAAHLDVYVNRLYFAEAWINTVCAVV